MSLSKLSAALVFLAAGAGVSAQTQEGTPQEMVVTTFCAKGAAVQAVSGTMRCNGAWMLTLQPTRGVAAHLVGGMSPAEARAVLEVTGVSYSASANGSIVVGRVELVFGNAGLEAVARTAASSTTGI